MKTSFYLLTAGWFTLAPLAAQAGSNNGGHGSQGGHGGPGKAEQTVAAEMTDAEIRKIDSEAAKITLKHSAIKNLDMPAMTMVFNVRDKTMLSSLKVGDKVKFKAVNDAGKYTVTELQASPQ
jgi:Cu(I)/Ag(I) efflux system periplasmic protein CusF